MSDTYVWPIISFKDARASAAFLVTAFGFEEKAMYARDDDPSVIEHGEVRWPAGGGVMFGSAGKDDSEFGRRRGGARPEGRGLRVPGLHRARPRGQPLELRDLQG